MPSAGDQNYLTRDVDVLVSGIKQNLKLSNFKEKSKVGRILRPTPYNRKATMPCIYTTDVNNSKKNAEEDPYLKLRQLVQQGRLINEAVKKLQTMNFEELSNEAEDDDYDEDEDDVVDRYRRKRYYSYDSEDEPIPAVYTTLDL